MKKVDLEKVKKVYFVGIGGIGMSALARLMKHERKEVSGSDTTLSEITSALSGEGIDVVEGQSIDLVPEDTDLVVYSDAVLVYDPTFLKEVDKKKIPKLSYFEALGVIANQYYLIVVAGTHGKTTTTAMLADVLEEAGLDPTVVVGSLRSKTRSNFRPGKSKYFVVEGDEYRRHLLHFTPDILVILNIEADHLDYYKDLADVQSAFKEVVGNIQEGGFVVCNPKDPLVEPVLEDVKVEVVDYTSYFDPGLELKVPGVHNSLNASACLAVADVLKIDNKEAKETLSSFKGTWRRAEFKGELESGALLYDDYAHHPTEVKATLSGFREMYPAKKITVIFQPHLYSRTKLLLDDFAKSFGDADEVLVLPIYAAREKEDTSISSEMLVEKINEETDVPLNTHDRSKIKVRAKYYESFEEVSKYIKKAGACDVVITMGAGDIYDLSCDLLF